MKSKSGTKGQSFLVLVLLVGGAVLLVSILLAFLATSVIDTGYGYQALAQAQAVASTGVQDAIIQLDRNASFSSAGYTIVVGAGTATVVVTQNSPSTGLITILSTATVSDRTRKMTAIVGVNATTSQMTITSWQVTQ